MPVIVKNAFIGDKVGPKSRKATARALVVNAKSPKFLVEFEPVISGSGSVRDGKRPP